MRIGIAGGGWAGLAAAVEAVSRGHEVVLHEMAGQLGGRARTLDADSGLDNGQHVLIGAYRATLDLMQRVGVDPRRLLHRQPLALVTPDRNGLQLRPGPPTLAFVRGVAGARGWHWRDRAAMLMAAGRWRAAAYACAPGTTVGELTASLTPTVQRQLIEPLCLAALNTPVQQACGATFLRVLRDAFTSGPGSADLLIPRTGLSESMPDPAARWLAARGAHLRLRSRVMVIEPDGDGWRIDGEAFDRVVIACPPHEAARLVAPIRPEWSAQTDALEHRAIATVYVQAGDGELPEAMLALPAARDEPAQFVFDLGRLGRRRGLLALVASAVAADIDVETLAAAASSQARRQLGPLLGARFDVVRTVIERRATLSCEPHIKRSVPIIAPGLAAAGDYVLGPYPSTLEGAVMSGRSSIERLA